MVTWVTFPLRGLCRLSIDDVPAYLKDQIKHFFEQYKALEKGKWVKVEGWAGIDAAHKEISEGLANFKK